jgi:glutamate-1-semialdehyde 2,1-aminomutase
MTAGIETLKMIQEPGVWQRMEERGAQLLAGLEGAAAAAGVPIQAARVGTMFGFFFAEEPVTDWNSASKADTDRFGAYFQAMLERGVYIAPSQFEVGFMSAVHGPEEIETTIAAAGEAFASLT